MKDGNVLPLAQQHSPAVAAVLIKMAADQAAAAPQQRSSSMWCTFGCRLGIKCFVFLPFLLCSRLDTQQQVPAGKAALLRLQWQPTLHSSSAKFTMLSHYVEPVMLHTSVASLGAGVLLIVSRCHRPFSLDKTWLSGNCARKASDEQLDPAFKGWLA